VNDYYTQNSSTVSAAALDKSKAFDKVNHVELFIKLLYGYRSHGYST